MLWWELTTVGLCAVNIYTIRELRRLWDHNAMLEGRIGQLMSIVDHIRSPEKKRK